MGRWKGRKKEIWIGNLGCNSQKMNNTSFCNISQALLWLLFVFCCIICESMKFYNKFSTFFLFFINNYFTLSCCSIKNFQLKNMASLWLAPLHGCPACWKFEFSRFVLSCGKDSSVKLWEVGSGRLVKQYIGATHTQLRCQVWWDMFFQNLDS